MPQSSLSWKAGVLFYYDFQTQGGSISAQRCTLYWDSGSAKAGYYEAFTAEKWCYTESGYFFFDQYRMPGYDGPPGEIGIRVKPLDSDCREYNRKYVIPVGYNRNSVLISDWSESDGFGSLNFYDLYDLMYRMKYGTEAPCPYAYTGAEYEIPASEFDSVLQSYLNISSDTIRSRTVYYPESDTYQYRPRGLEDAEYPYPPYPEVTACETQAGRYLKADRTGCPDHEPYGPGSHQRACCAASGRRQFSVCLKSCDRNHGRHQRHMVHSKAHGG